MLQPAGQGEQCDSAVVVVMVVVVMMMMKMMMILVNVMAFPFNAATYLCL